MKDDDSKFEDLDKRVYPEDERLREIQEDPDRRMTRQEWEREESLARQAVHKKHTQVRHDREVQQEHDKKHHPNPHRWRRIALGGGVAFMIVLAIFLAGYIPRRREAKRAEKLAKQRQTETPQVEVTRVFRSQAPGELTIPGTTAPLTEAFLYARANGYLRSRFVDIGDRVRAGQLLAVIDAPDLDQQVDQARQQLHQAEAQLSQQQAQLNLSRVTWERWRILVTKGVFSRQDGDQREADFQAQAATVDSATRNVESYRANLNRMIALQRFERITAPFDGIITQRNADVGALVGASGAAATAPMPGPQNPSAGSAAFGTTNTSGASGSPSQAATPSTGEASGGPIFAIAEIDTLRILVSAPEGYASGIHRGMPAQVFLQERTGKPIQGTVTRAANSIDQNTRTMLVEVDIDNRDAALYPGMYALVSFVQVRGQAPLIVPGDAVVVRNDQTSVATLEDGKIQIVPVEIGRDYGPYVEIVDGLHENQWIVSTVTDDVRNGIKVNPKQSDAASPESLRKESEINQTPDYGPGQYGDQSIVNAQSESTNQSSKPSQKSGQNKKQQKGQGQ